MAKPIFFTMHAELLIMFIWIIKIKPQKKTRKTRKWEPVAIWFVVYSYKQGPLSIAYGSSAELLMHFQIDLQLIYFANNIPVLFIIIVPGNYTNVADPEPLSCN